MRLIPRKPLLHMHSTIYKQGNDNKKNDKRRCIETIKNKTKKRQDQARQQDQDQDARRQTNKNNIAIQQNETRREDKSRQGNDKTQQQDGQEWYQ